MLRHRSMQQGEDYRGHVELRRFVASDMVNQRFQFCSRMTLTRDDQRDVAVLHRRAAVP